MADKKAEAARLAKELDTDGNKVSLAAERFNQTQLALAGVQAQIGRAKSDLAHADERMQAAKSLMSVAAVQSYVTGGSVNLLAHLAHSDNNDLVMRQQYLRFTAADQRDVIGQVRAAKEDFAAVQARLSDDEKNARAAADAADAAKRQASDAEATERNLLGQVNGELAAMVADESARRQAAQLTLTPAADSQTSGPPAASAPKPRSAGATPAAPSSPPKAIAAPPSSGGAGAAVAEAERQVGKPYVYGGSGPDSFDCSGLMMWAWRAGGVSLSHSAQAQYSETTRVPLSALQPGDILFFGSSTSSIGHDAMYVGGGQMVEAPHTGLNVRYAGAFRSDLVGAGRPG